METNNLVKDLFGIPEDAVLERGIDIGLGVVPLLGKVYQSYKMIKLNRRVQQNLRQLTAIKEKIEHKENEVFYKQEVFPVIFKNLVEEDQDEKAKVIIDGFEHIVDEDVRDIEKIYHYYDVLNELRYSDILELLSEYLPYHKRKRLTISLDVPDPKRRGDREYWDKRKEMTGIRKYQKTKFIRLGLIEDLEESHRKEMTEFGERFLDFFSIEEPDE